MKRKNKQMIGTALAVTMILGSLSGCVPQKTSSPAPETTAQAESKEGESDKPLMNETGMPIVNSSVSLKWLQNPDIIKTLQIWSFPEVRAGNRGSH